MKTYVISLLFPLKGLKGLKRKRACMHIKMQQKKERANSQGQNFDCLCLYNNAYLVREQR
jgi:hypothetical protein